MHVGLGLSFQNLIPGQSDSEVYRHELQLAARAEVSGFDSVWTPEHHFTDYMMTPNVTQFLSWVAGRSQRVFRKWLRRRPSESSRKQYPTGSACSAGSAEAAARCR